MGVEKWIDAQLHPERIDDRDDRAAREPVLGLNDEDARTSFATTTSCSNCSARRRRPRARTRRWTSGTRAARCSRRIRSSPRPRVRRSSSSARFSRRSSRARSTSERQLERSDGRLLGESLQRLRRQGTDALLPRAVRSRRHSSARARQVPRSARRGGEESGDAVLPRQLAERGRQHAAHARRAQWRTRRTRRGLIARRPAGRRRSADSSCRPRRASDCRTPRPKSASS